MKKIILFSLMLSLTACAGIYGRIGNSTISDETLKEKAASALGTSADKVTISNRRVDGLEVKFTATTKNKPHQCYVTSTVSVIGVVTSDAICSKSSRSSKTTKNSNSSNSCNALLKAAGRC